MTKYDNRLFSTDLDAFKHTSDGFLTTSITFSGTIGHGGQMTQSSTAVSRPVNTDFTDIIFDSSTKHPGRFKSVWLEQQSMIHESTNGSELSIFLFLKINGGSVVVSGIVNNPYNVTITLETTTLNFRIISAETTI